MSGIEEILGVLASAAEGAGAAAEGAGAGAAGALGEAAALAGAPFAGAPTAEEVLGPGAAETFGAPPATGGAAKGGSGAGALAPTHGAAGVPGMGSGAEALLQGGQLGTGTGGAGSTSWWSAFLDRPETKGFLEGVKDLGSRVTGGMTADAAMKLMQIAASRQPNPVSIPPLGRAGGGGTRPSVQQFLQMLSQRAQPGLRR